MASVLHLDPELLPAAASPMRQEHRRIDDADDNHGHHEQRPNWGAITICAGSTQSKITSHDFYTNAVPDTLRPAPIMHGALP
jgi:hypothetical protein